MTMYVIANISSIDFFFFFQSFQLFVFFSVFFSTMHLLSLPNELLELIASFLQHACELNFFSQTSKHLYLLFNHELYKRNSTKRPNNFALEWAAQHGYEKTAQKALKAGASPFLKTCTNRTPIQVATIEGHDAIVRLFLEEVDFSNEYCWDYIHGPLVSAANNGHGSIVQLLVTYGAPVYKYDPEQARYPVPLGLAVEYRGDLDSIKHPTKAHNHEQMQYIGPYAISIAAASGNMSAAQYFLDKGIDLNLFDERTRSYPIFHAANNGHLGMVCLLLENGVKFDTKADTLLRSLTLAAGKKHYVVAEHLASVTGLEGIFQSENTSDHATLLAVAAIC